MTGETIKDPAAAWPPERVATYSTKDVEELRKNALRKGVQTLVERCDSELLRRAPQKKKQIKTAQAAHSERGVVVGYHVVCADNRGVTQLEDGSFRSGSWVISEQNVRRSLEHGAYLALHETKSQPSYRQGRIINYARTLRNMVDAESGVKTDEGIEFLVQATTEPYAWVGTAAGEKGYLWSETVSRVPAPDAPEGEKS